MGDYNEVTKSEYVLLYFCTPLSIVKILKGKIDLHV